jgi:hypothetical protein
VKTLKGIQLVKCGKCPACENALRSELRAKVQFEENNALSCFFITNTYSDVNLPLFCLRNDLVEDFDKQYDKLGNTIDDEFYRSLKPLQYTDINGIKRTYDGSFSLASRNVGFFPLLERIQKDNYNKKLDSWCLDLDNSIFSRCILGRSTDHYDDMLASYHSQLESNVAKCRSLGVCNNSLSWYDYVDNNYLGLNHSDCVPLLYYPDLQRFIKRLRKLISKLFPDEKIRYYAIGEYGTSSYRPHWHILLFTNSVNITRWLQQSFYKNDVLSKEHRTINSSTILDSLWQYGTSTIDKTDGKASGYISNYVVGTSVLPKVLTRVAPQKTFHSVRFGCPYSKSEVRELLLGRNYERFSKIEYVDSTDSSLQSRPLWRSYYSLFFPQFVGINSLPDCEKYRVLTIYPKLASWFFETNVRELARKIYLRCIAPYRKGKVLSDVDAQIAKFFDWFDWSAGTTRTLSPLLGVLYASKRFLNLSSDLGFTPRQYFDIWRDFVQWRDYKCLVQHYNDCRTNEIYLNCYYNIYSGTDVSINYLNDSALFKTFRYDALRTNQRLVKHKAFVEQLKGI